MSDTGQHEMPEPTMKNPMLSDGAYKNLEWSARVALPALATLYLALATIWGFSYGPEVVGTIVAVDTFLGVFLGFAQKSYDASDAKYNGSIVVTPGPNGSSLSELVLDKDPSQLAQLVLKVDKQS